MKQKRKKWATVPWTEFLPAVQDTRGHVQLQEPVAVFVNSRYQVSVFMDEVVEPFGVVAHLSIKTHDKQAHHDWRDLQRIKNEICGSECDAVEIYPAESKLVDGANQYHLFVFQTYRLPFGFQSRMVADGTWGKSKQRPFPVGERPADCLDPSQFDQMFEREVAKKREKEGEK